jgi:membrane protease YdiL (CAAX protease family)
MHAPLGHALLVAAALLPLAAGVVLAARLAASRSSSLRAAWRPTPEALARLAGRPWRTGDAAALLALVILLFAPAVLAEARGTAVSAGASTGATLVWVLFTYGALFGGVALAARRSGLGLCGALGLRRGTLAPALRAGVAGGLVATPAVLLLAAGVQAALQRAGVATRPQAVFDWLSDPRLAWPAKAVLVAAAALLAPLAEEAVFRGVLLPAVLRRCGWPAALTLVSVLFALLHGHLAVALPLAVLGAAFSLGLAATGSVLTPIVMHVLFNAESLLLFAAFPNLAA